LAPANITYLIFNNGGSMNGRRMRIRTTYFEHTAIEPTRSCRCLLKPTKCAALVINKANLDNQRNAVQEERRLGVDNQPYGQSSEVQQGLIYDNFAYKHTVIGSMDDLNAASVEDVAAFFKTYYAPNNAVLAVVGDFKTADAIKKIKQYFESIPRQPDPPAVDMTEPEQKAERRASVDDGLARLAQVDIAFKTVPATQRTFTRCKFSSTRCKAARVHGCTRLSCKR
jgi:predicted Zn-dependent peptidase